MMEPPSPADPKCDRDLPQSGRLLSTNQRQDYLLVKNAGVERPKPEYNSTAAAVVFFFRATGVRIK